MSETMRRKPPLPVAQSFVTCHEVFRGMRSGTTLLLGPVAHVPVEQFPATVRLDVFAEFTGGHGTYRPALSLRNGSGEIVWGWPAAPPFEHADPLLPTEVVFNGLMIAVPRPGRYTLVLLLNDEQAAERAVWFGPAEAFRSAVPV